MALGDFFQDSPSFVNPEYATDAQRKQQRTYAEMLMKRSSEKVNRPAGAIANMIDALTGRLEMNRAGNLEQQALSKSTDQQAALIAALQQPQQPQQDAQGAQTASLTAPPAAPNVGATPPMGTAGSSMVPAGPVTDPTNSPRGEVQSSPKVWGDKEAEAAGLYPQVASLSPGGAGAPAGPQGQPPVLPTAGAPATPNQRVAQSFDPKLLSGILNNQMSSPEAKAMIGQLIGQKQGADVYGNPTRESLVGGIQALPVGRGVTPGVQTPTTISPTGISGTSFNPASSAQPGLAVGGSNGLGGAIKTMNQLGNNAARAGAVGEFQKQDLQAANDAPTIKRVAGVMLDDLNTHGDKMTMGPTADWSNNIRKVAANYAPGLMKDQLESLASADSFEKMSAQLTGLLSKGGGTDAQLFNNLKSVPGAHNSLEGAKALLKMVNQTADQSQALAQFTAKAKDYEEYQALKNQFYAQNPIINPITGHPIKQDLEGQKSQGSTGGSRIIKVHE